MYIFCVDHIHYNVKINIFCQGKLLGIFLTVTVTLMFWLDETYEVLDNADLILTCDLCVVCV